MVMTWAGRGGRGSGSSRLKGALEAAVREARANPRVLIGLVAILLLLWGYGLIGLFDSVDAAGRRLADAEAEIRRTTMLAGEAGWDARAVEAEGLKQRLLARLWGGETEGRPRPTSRRRSPRPPARADSAARRSGSTAIRLRRRVSACACWAPASAPTSRPSPCPIS